MFKEYFERLEKVRTQLLEGAITHEEFFNRIVCDAVELTNTAEYAEHMVLLSEVQNAERAAGWDPNP